MKLHMNDAPKSYYAKAVRQSLFSYQAVQSIADLIYWLEKHQSSGSRPIGSTLNVGVQTEKIRFCKIDAKFYRIEKVF